MGMHHPSDSFFAFFVSLPFSFWSDFVDDGSFFDRRSRTLISRICFPSGLKRRSPAFPLAVLSVHVHASYAVPVGGFFFPLPTGTLLLRRPLSLPCFFFDSRTHSLDCFAQNRRQSWSFYSFPLLILNTLPALSTAGVSTSFTPRNQTFYSPPLGTGALHPPPANPETETPMRYLPSFS